MPRYYFDFDDEDRRTWDDEGIDLLDLETARADLMEAMGEITKDVMPDGNRRDLIGVVRDETGTPVLRATFSLRVERL